jgi:hypothetical protein
MRIAVNNIIDIKNRIILIIDSVMGHIEDFLKAKTILWVATHSTAASRHFGQADIQLLREKNCLPTSVHELQTVF